MEKAVFLFLFPAMGVCLLLLIGVSAVTWCFLTRKKAAEPKVLVRNAVAGIPQTENKPGTEKKKREGKLNALQSPPPKPLPKNRLPLKLSTSAEEAFQHHVAR